MRRTLSVVAAAVIAPLLAGCGANGGVAEPTSTPTRTPTLVGVPSETPFPTLTPAPAGNEPIGFPMHTDFPTDLVVGTPGARTIQRRAGPPVREVSERVQLLDDPDAANASGWNCRVHAEYESGVPAVDWYVQQGTLVHATHDGTATMHIVTLVNGFSYYGIDREPYIGNPDRLRAPVNVFPGPGGGLGLYVSIANDEYRTEYGHLHAASIAGTPHEAFFNGYTPEFGYTSAFNEPHPNAEAVAIARWSVRRGEVIGYTGDAGYSEAPHLHYQITRLSDGAKLCPTREAGFTDGGWLLR